MHITILALGSRGDVLPYATLGQGLRAAGHQVRLATFESFAAVITARDLEFHAIRGDARAILNTTSGQALAQSGQNPIRMARAVIRSFGVMARTYADDLAAAVLWETDLIVNQLPGGLYGYDLAEKLGVPMIAAAVMPLVPTKTQPLMAFPTLFAPVPGYNTWTHWMGYQMVWQWFRPTINRWRRETLGLSNAPLWGYPRLMCKGHVPVLNGFSQHIVPRPPDWGDHIHITGYWFPENPEWQPPDKLRRFIESGSPPVFVGFGSMPVQDPKRVTRIVLDALELSGQRSILHTGWGGIGDGDLPDDVYPIDYAPYGWLFPQMGAIVHHGGSGTTAFGLRAGVPSLVVPFLFDQFYWGQRLQALGVGPRPLPYKKLSAERLAEALRQSATDPQMQQRAAELGARIREEDGVQEAIKIITETEEKQSA